MTERLLPLLLLLGVAFASAVPPSQPNPVYDASKYSSPSGNTKNGLLIDVNVPGSILPFQIMHLYGNATERGFAHGELLAPTIIDFVEKQLPQYYKEEISELDLSGLPKWLQDLIKNAGKAASGTIAKVALGYILNLFGCSAA